MATKIITNKRDWQPVKIEIEFTTREQLAVFVALMGDTHDTACMIRANDALRFLNTANHMSIDCIDKTIDSIMDIEVWRELKDIASAG